jgi:predicted DCC family thiol-disulfide oxidoreductase YuxK
MRRLFVLYDACCPICESCRRFLERRTQLVSLCFVPAQGLAAREIAGRLPWLGRELVVVDDLGRAWAGPAAFLMCFWALKRWRCFATLFTFEPLCMLAEGFFKWVSGHRSLLSAVFGSAECRHCTVPQVRTIYRG